MGRIKVGLQLYSISDYMQKDMDKALGEVKAMGYDYVEFAGYYDKSAEEIKTLLEKYGLECVSIHRGLNRFDDNKESEMNYIRVLGAKYCVIPWYEVSKLAGGEEWENTVKRFTNHAEDMKEIGVKLLYHNHSFEFNKFEGKYLIDHIYETIELSMPLDVTDNLFPVYDQLYNAVEGNAELTIKPEQALRVMKVMEAAFESHENKKYVNTNI